MRTTLILLLAVLIAGCGASNVQVIKPVNGDVKPFMTPEMQKSRCYNILTGGQEGEAVAKKANLLMYECNLTVPDVIDRLSMLTYSSKDSYTAESGEKYVISKRVTGNKDVEVQTKYYYEKENKVRGIEILIQDFVDPNYDKSAAPDWTARALYRELQMQDGKLIVVRDGITRDEFMEMDRIEHYKMINRMLQEKK
jgi:hypothetical protein